MFLSCQNIHIYENVDQWHQLRYTGTFGIAFQGYQATVSYKQGRRKQEGQGEGHS